VFYIIVLCSVLNSPSEKDSCPLVPFLRILKLGTNYRYFLIKNFTQIFLAMKDFLFEELKQKLCRNTFGSKSFNANVDWYRYHMYLKT
jgi:hypothetical protein